jgi:hypothetical protein
MRFSDVAGKLEFVCDDGVASSRLRFSGFRHPTFSQHFCPPALFAEAEF